MSNRDRGNNFASRVEEYLSREGHTLKSEYSIEIGLGAGRRKAHRFDLGNESLLVECKRYTWTEGGNNPSAKMSTLNEALLHFIAAPESFRKLLFISKTEGRGKKQPESLAERFVRVSRHLVPDGVEVWEFDEEAFRATRLFPDDAASDTGPSHGDLTDTAPAAARVQAGILSRKSGVDRLLLAFDMSHCARELSFARLRQQHPDWPEAELRRELLRYAFLPGDLPRPLR